MKHKYADVLIAIAEGKVVQWREHEGGRWYDAGFKPYTPLTNDELQWRIKPEPKPDEVRYLTCNPYYETFKSTKAQYHCDNLKLTFEGETGKLMKAEVL